MVNGHYRPAYLGDLGACGCQVGATADAGSGFDLSSIPLWAWIAAGAAVFLMMTKKQGR